MGRLKKEQNEPLIKNLKLKAGERETVIQYDDASNIATIWCSKKDEIEKLKRKKGIKVVEEHKYGTRFEIDKKEIKIGTTQRVRRVANRQEAK